MGVREREREREWGENENENLLRNKNNTTMVIRVQKRLQADEGPHPGRRNAVLRRKTF